MMIIMIIWRLDEFKNEVAAKVAEVGKATMEASVKAIGAEMRGLGRHLREEMKKPGCSVWIN